MFDGIDGSLVLNDLNDSIIQFPELRFFELTV